MFLFKFMSKSFFTPILGASGQSPMPCSPQLTQIEVEKLNKISDFDKKNRHRPMIRPKQ